MDALDEAYTSWMRDLRLGKARLMVPQQYLESQGRGKGATLDLDKEVFVALNTLGAANTMEIVPNQFAIRYAEHKATCDDLMIRIVSGCGYSAQTFGLSADIAITATEVEAKERMTFDTREAKIEVAKRKLYDLVCLMLDVDTARGIVPPFTDDLLVEFPQAVEEDQLTIAQTIGLLRTAQAASTETLIRMAHPDWDDDRINEEIEKIEAEKPAPPIIVPPIAPHSTPNGKSSYPPDDSLNPEDVPVGTYS
jgi:A118 family predicted phage portal protein